MNNSPRVWEGGDEEDELVGFEQPRIRATKNTTTI
jgi:hypothetical protein